MSVNMAPRETLLWTREQERLRKSKALVIWWRPQEMAIGVFCGEKRD